MPQSIDLLLAGWQQNLHQAEVLFATIPAERMTEQPRVVNHPAWTLAHLIHYHRPILNLARGEAVQDPGKHSDAPHYDAGSTPVDDLSQYPTKDELLMSFRDGHERIAHALEVAPADLMEQPAGLPRWAESFGATADALGYLMIFHEAVHLGQVMAWRRALGMGPLD